MRCLFVALIFDLPLVTTLDLLCAEVWKFGDHTWGWGSRWIGWGLTSPEDVDGCGLREVL
jgi:hypothetical protein